MIWAKEETMSRAEIEAIQLKRLKETVRRVYEKVCLLYTSDAADDLIGLTAGRWRRWE